MTSTNFTSSTASVLTTPSTTPTPTSSRGVFTTWPSTTYTLPTLTSWGSTPNGFGDFNVGDRILQLVTSGSNGEKIVRGFLMGVAIGFILGGAVCCWVPCFGRGRQERRERRRQQREQGRDGAQQHPGGQADGQTTTAAAQAEGAPAAERSYVRLRWDRFRRRPRL
ncbi:hypothetical protein J3458_000983 [Metarhizium acridum]|uniref:uncharacterized protein n=1 Tax=Metarhizium acridum TaxID=92637 RepID=UPI001C6AC17D|nr:hypothetical protein J3458_000983 [Metarhizium acridum]